MNQLSNTLWYTPTPMEHQQQKTYPFFYLNSNNHVHNYDDVNSDNNSTSNAETASSTTITTPTPDKEHMFEKPLTPSDVGKLNRLVIPKQHAEKYLPLSAVSAAAAAADTGGGGGLLLGFEDETGKSWKFRYSYWNSSQSYVLTKGWSRYVKEKKLDAGDVVLFERHRFEPDRLFIGWRRRGTNSPVQPSSGWTGRSSSSYNFNNFNNNNNNNNNNYNYQYNNNHQQNVVQSQQSYTPSHQISVFPNFPTENVHEGTVQVRQKAKKSGNSKRVRLFGVNLECQLEEDDDQAIDYESQTSDGSSLSCQSQGQGYGSGSTIAPTSYNYYDYMGYPPNHHEHMDMNFSHDSNQQMRNRLG